MPMLHAVAHDIGGAADHPADGSLVEELARRLRPGAEEGVGSAAELEPALVGLGDELLAPRSALSAIGFSE